MFPNAPNCEIKLINIKSELDPLGVKRPKVKSSRTVVGIKKSITSSDTTASASIGKTYDVKVSVQSFLYGEEKYAILGGKSYKIEKTYVSGEFTELYLSLNDLDMEGN